MSSDTSELLRKHFKDIDEEEAESTSSQSRTHSHLPGQLEAEEAKELEEALRLSAQEAMERQKKKSRMAPNPTQERGESSNASVTPRKRKASSDTTTSSPIMEKGITITTHSPLGQEWVEQLGGMVVHSTYLHNPTTRFKVCYHTSECYKALRDPEVIPHLDTCGLGKMKCKLPCHLNMDYVVQFVKNYNRNTKQTRIVSTEGQEK